MYPYSSDIIQKVEDMMDAMESLYICPEIIGKKCMLVSNHITTHIFSVCKDLFLDQNYISLFRKLYTQIPIIIVDDDDDNNIEILNYANARVKLSFNEFKFLVIESGKKKIALNKIVQFVVVKTKLKDSQLCIIADNIYANAEKIFGRVISHKLAYVDEEGVKAIAKRYLKDFTALLLSDEVKMSSANNEAIKDYRCINFESISDFVKNEVFPVLYGFFDEFLSVETQIMDYYEKQLIQSKSVVKEVVGDIVRLGNSDDLTLQSIRTIEEMREKKLKTESKEINKVLKNIEDMIVDISVDLEDNYITGKKIPRYTIDDIFESFFRCQSFSGGLGKKILSRIYSYEYDNYELIATYVQAVSGKNIKYDAIEIDDIEWEKAKMLISILNPEKIPLVTLKSYIDILGKRCISGKELYAKSLLFTDSEKIEILQDSFNRGYETAGMELLDMYKKGYRTVNLISLVNSLVPEACMILAERNMSGYKSKRRYADLTDKEFTYYKIAASRQFLPAIGKIVDVVFESRFSQGFQIPLDDIDNEKYAEMISNGHEICRLCQFLIGKMYQVNHYSEILGIILFSINEDLSGSMNLLSNANSALAYYCKGNMYEFGGGVSIDLEKAIKNYEESISKGMQGRVERRLAACYSKLERYSYENNRDDYYQPTRSYSSSYTYTGSSTYNDGCFTPNTKILMANGTYCEVKDIKVGDYVMIFDHYNGAIGSEQIVANVHDVSGKDLFDVIEVIFENGISLNIVKSHVLFDLTIGKYVWIDADNVVKFVGHEFVLYEKEEIVGYKMVDYNVEIKETEYFVPISKMHLNVFAENVLTMPPTLITTNMFKVKSDLTYDLANVDMCGITSYNEISSIVTQEEYNDLPCKYLNAVLFGKEIDVNDFKYAISLYRNHKKYLEIGD